MAWEYVKQGFHGHVHPTSAVYDVDTYVWATCLNFVKKQCSETGITKVEFLWPIFNGCIRGRWMIWSASSPPLAIYGESKWQAEMKTFML